MSTDVKPLHKPLSLPATFVVLLIPLVWTFEASAVGPALGAIAHAFPASGDLQIEMVMTMPFLASMFFSVVSGRLARYFDKKIILLTGLFIYGVTGMSPVLATSMTQILVLRFLTGIGVGLVLPIPSAIITERFAGDKRRRMLGLTSSIANLANVIASLVSGALLVFGWQYPFYTFAVVLIIMLFAIGGVPSSPPVMPATSSNAPVRRLRLGAYRLSLFMTLNSVFVAMITTTIAIFMTKEQVGEPWMIGLAISMPACACLVVSGFYPEVRRLSRGGFTALAFLFSAVGFVLISNAHSIYGVSAGAFLVGVGNGLLTPHILALTADGLPPAEHDAALGLVTAGISAGAFLSPLVQSLFILVTGNHSYRFMYLAAGIVLTCFGGLSLFSRRQTAVAEAGASDARD